MLIELIDRIVDTFPAQLSSWIHLVAFEEVRYKTVRVSVNEVAFSSNTDRCQDVISRAHDVSNPGFVQLFDDLGRAVF